MPAYTSLPSGGRISESNYGTTDGANRYRQFQHKVPISAGAASATFPFQLPPLSVTVMSQLVLANTLSVSGTSGTNGTADSIAIIGSTSTTPTTGTATSLSNEFIRITSLSSGAFAASGTRIVNTATTPLYLFAIPIANTGTHVSNIIQTATTGYKFIGTSTSTSTYGLVCYTDVQSFTAIDTTV